MTIRRVLIAGAAVFVAATAVSAETITYSYDAQGRLVKVVHTGNVNDGQQVQYTLDAAGNRVRVQVTGAP